MSAALIVGMETTSWRGPEPPIRSAKLGFQASIFQLPKASKIWAVLFWVGTLFGVVLQRHRKDARHAVVFCGGAPPLLAHGFGSLGQPKSVACASRKARSPHADVSMRLFPEPRNLPWTPGGVGGEKLNPGGADPSPIAKHIPPKRSMGFP